MMKKALAVMALLMTPGCAGLFGTPDEVRQGWSEYEALERAAMEREVKREAREQSILEKLIPADEEARVEKALLVAEVEADHTRAGQERVAKLEILRAIASYLNAPGLLGSPEQQARADERLLMLISAIKQARSKE